MKPTAITRKIFIFSFGFFLLFLTLCCIENKIEKVEFNVSNPASVYCNEQNGTLEIRKDKGGNEYGVCIFPDGTECEEWAFFRGECKKGEKEKFCSYDAECAQEESKCADGIDPYHKCISGKCVNLTFIRDPCLDHVCPKGNWHRKTENSCFRYDRCAEKGCNDGSSLTKDECIGIGTRSEGCLYTIVEDNKKYFCEKNSDCVPEQCCHPTSCINREFAPNCEGIFCTMVCKGPIDCGAGKCSCVNNKCIVEKLLTK